MRSAFPLRAFFAGALPVFVVILWMRPSAYRPPAAELREIPADASWVAIFGATDPSGMQFSLAQDAEALRELLPRDGALLFGGGEGSFVQRAAEPDESLRSRLGDFFDPRDRAVRYVGGPDADAPADLDTVLNLLDGIDEGERPLLLYFGGHGDGGDAPADSATMLWGGSALGVQDLARVLDASERPTQVVVTTCFGGGFADLAFHEGDPSRGPAHTDRCGVFATSWDTLASGCDPNPSTLRDDYTVHLLAALRGQDRAGAPLTIDYDGNQTTGLLDAHTHARIAAGSIDVPTTTSERWLAHVALELDVEAFAEAPAPRLPEEEAVVDVMGAAFGLTTDEEAQRAHAEAVLSLESAEAALEELHDRVDDAWFALRIVLLERWPMLDDPWHPDFGATLARDADRIDRALRQSPEAEAHRAALMELQAREQEVEQERVRVARLRRLVEAHDALVVARALEAADPAGWRTFERLRACERRQIPR